MYRTCLKPRCIRWHRATCAIVALACALAIEPAARGSRLFLLSDACCLNDTNGTFPVRLYTTNSQHKLMLLRTVVSSSEGTTELLDDMQGKIYVAFPSDLGPSRAPTKISIIHEGRPWENDVVTFNPRIMPIYPYAAATATGSNLGTYALFTMFPEPPPTLNGHAAFMRYIRSSATTLVAIAGNPPAQGQRMTKNDWGLYSHLTFYGLPGGPSDCFTPLAVIESGDLVMRLGGRSVVIDKAPPIPASAQTSRTIWILAANRRFLVCIPLHFGGGNYTVPATMYVHDRGSKTWKQLKSAGSMPQCRIFGPWLATRVRNSLKRGGGLIENKNPGHMDESDHWVLNLLPNVRSEFDGLDSSFYIPGTLTLDNLADGRRIMLKTHEEDSEVLAVRKDGLVLYRVNDKVFSAHIEGDKLSLPTLVVKGEDVPEIHWVFWSNAEVKNYPAGLLSAGP